jgi:ribosomal protein S18 acetylase RimI-like enzyme
MPDNPDIFVRPMHLRDLKSVMELSIAEGWNQTEKDWRLLLDNQLNTCIISQYDQKVIGTATAINYSNLEGWIGMVLVDKEFRRQGVGRMLVTNIIERSGGFKSVKLDATPAGQPLYQKLGFIEERVLYRMINPCFKSIDNDTIDLTPERIQLEDFEEIIKFDKNIFGVDRSYLIKTIFQNYPGKAFLLKRNDRICGYILGRDGIKFNYIGPVFALTNTGAKALISKSIKSLCGQSVALDVQSDKIELIEWLESIGFIRQRQFVRMYLKNNPFPGKVKNQYLIIGPEYG